MARSRRPAATESTLRIIGGRWRGRKFGFTPEEGLRPTADRIRETLFNWLAPEIPGARCLDLFAGSGALGLEALSRGADSCDFVDTSAAAVSRVRQLLDSLHCATGRCHRQLALEYLNSGVAPFDIVFIDPPFGRSLVDPVCARLAAVRLVVPGGLVYVETGVREPPPQIPPGWRLHREKTAGEVAYRLYRNEAG